MQKMLGDEFGTASNIKSRVNRQSVLGAITSCQQRLKLYNRVRPGPLPLWARPHLPSRYHHHRHRQGGSCASVVEASSVYT